MYFVTAEKRAGKTANDTNSMKKAWKLETASLRLMNNCIKMTDIKTATEKQIVNYLDKNGPSMLGELVKELKLSYTNGLNTIKQLQDKGIIKQSTAKVLFALNPK